MGCYVNLRNINLENQSNSKKPVKMASNRFRPLFLKNDYFIYLALGFKSILLILGIDIGKYSL